MMRFYKITNEEEYHNGLQYRDGLVEDVKPFNPSGSCLSGGIYFSREDILGFINHGPWIREVILPYDAKVYKDPSKDPVKWKADKVFLGPRRRIDAGVIKELLEEGANVHAWDDAALIWAANNGHLEVARLLLEHGADFHAWDDSALRWTAKNGHVEVVQVLLKHGADVHANNDVALRLAANNGHVEVVELLLKHGADIHALDDYALRWTANNGHFEVIELLLKHGADVHARNNEALRWASEWGHFEVAQLLLEQGINDEVL